MKLSTRLILLFVFFTTIPSLVILIGSYTKIRSITLATLVFIGFSALFVARIIIRPIEVLEEKVLERTKQLADIDAKYKELISDFISVASHQLKTPIVGLQWTLESLKIPDTLLDETQKSYLRNIYDFVKRLVFLTDGLLDVSHIELGMVSMVPQKVNLKDFVDSFVKEMKQYANIKQHTIVNEVGVDLAVAVDIKMLYNVLQSLATNAIDYSPIGSAVVLGAYREDKAIRLFVRNVGRGLSIGEQSRIFERFYRSEWAKHEKPAGTGIGLYIAKSFVAKWGGSIGVVSKEGDTTEFWFTIPLSL